MKKRTIAIVAILISVLAFSLSIFHWFVANQTESLAITPDSVLQDFAGKYYEGDGLGASFSLSIQPDKTFSFQAGTDMGWHWEYEGTIVNSLNQIQLISTERVLFEPHDLLPVKWGDRRYLIAKDSVSDFCEWVKKGWEPREEIFGIVYLRINDWEIPAKGHQISPQGDLICP